MKHEFFQDTNFSKICFGCEPLGGTDWGDIDLNKIEEAINLYIEKGLNFLTQLTVMAWDFPKKGFLIFWALKEKI